MRTLRIPVEGPCAIDNVQITLPYLQECGGGSIEAGRLNDAMMFVDEDGGLKSEPKVNQRATEIAGQVIVGNVVIVGPTDGLGNSTAVPQRYIDAVRARGWVPRR